MLKIGDPNLDARELPKQEEQKVERKQLSIERRPAAVEAEEDKQQEVKETPPASKSGKKRNKKNKAN